MREFLRSAYTLFITLLGLIGVAAGAWFNTVAMESISDGIQETADIAPIQVVFGSALMIAGAILLAAAVVRAAIRHGQEPPSDY